MFENLKRLWKSKISITIVYPSAVELAAPVAKKIDEPFIKHIHQSNLRFVSESKNGKDTFYFTEIYKEGRWAFADDSLSGNKNEAMALHMRIANGERITVTPVKEILWQGLAKEQAETWVAMNSTLTDKSS